jgi:hypothetical protein
MPEMTITLKQQAKYSFSNKLQQQNQTYVELQTLQQVLRGTK